MTEEITIPSDPQSEQLRVFSEIISTLHRKIAELEAENSRLRVRMRGADPSGAARKVEHIMDVTNLSLAAIARLLSIARQTIYGWGRGASISADNEEKLDQLVRITDELIRAGEPVSGRVLAERMRYVSANE